MRGQNPQRPAIAQLQAIAQSLLPKAASYARKGRPRLLAVCARIILSQKRIQDRYDEKHVTVAQMLRHVKATKKILRAAHKR